MAKDDVGDAIAHEVRRAFRNLGADPDKLLPEGILIHQVFRALQELGAKPDLLSVVANYGNGAQNDEWVLDELRRWNDRAEAAPEVE